MKASHLGFALLGLFLACGIAAAGYFIGQTMVNAKTAVHLAD